MTAPNDPRPHLSVWTRIRSDTRGAGYMAAFIILFGTLSVVGVGILVDWGRVVSVDRQCGSMALEAARAGANALDDVSVRTGEITLDPAEAQAEAAAAAAAFVSGSGASISSVTVNGNRVTVTVTATVDPWFPILSARTVSGTATVEAQTGISDQGQ